MIKFQSTNELQSALIKAVRQIDTLQPFYSTFPSAFSKMTAFLKPKPGIHGESEIVTELQSAHRADFGGNYQTYRKALQLMHMAVSRTSCKMLALYKCPRTWGGAVADCYSVCLWPQFLGLESWYVMQNQIISGYVILSLRKIWWLCTWASTLPGWRRQNSLAPHHGHNHARLSWPLMQEMLFRLIVYIFVH